MSSMNLSLEEIWTYAADFITFNPERDNAKCVDELEKYISLLEDSDLLDMILYLHLDNFDKDLEDRILPNFVQRLKESGSKGLPEAMKLLNKNIKWYISILDAFPQIQASRINVQLKDSFRASVFSMIHSQKNMLCFKNFYSQSFKEFTSEKDSEDMISECDTKLNTLNTENLFIDLGLFGDFYIKPVTTVLQSEIKSYVEEQCKTKYEELWLNGVLENWLQEQVMPWVQGVLQVQNKDTLWFYSEMKNLTDIENTILKWNKKVQNILYEAYTQMRIQEMFNIITDYPESCPAIQDLIVCLEHTNQRPFLIDALKKDLPKRVLHPGVCTSDIITLYIPAVKVLRMLDPTGVVMEIVLEPCTKYLKEREDAVRMIMTGLLDDENGSNELASELAKGADQDNSSLVIGNDNDAFLTEKVISSPEDWKPDPREADPERSDKFRRTSDIISLLVGMYGTKDRFIMEYQKLLSQRLLSTWFTESSEDTEIKNLELLKMRFGEDNTGMMKCAVMLKDVADSRRINTYVNEEYMKSVEKKPEVDVSAMIVSSEFWPDIQPHDLNLPAKVQNALDIFQKGYDSHKASRSLKWMNNIGKVDLELELKDRTLTFNHITPLLASIIYLFQDKENWTLSEISCELKVPSTMIRRKIAYWLQEGVLKETSDNSYCICESSGSHHAGQNRSLIQHDEDDEDETSNNESAKQKEELILWNYIKGMLVNFKSLPLDKIHKMLRMFAMQDASVMMEQSKLNVMLQKKVQEGALSFEHGQFMLL